jgi:hypothetical protein
MLSATSKGVAFQQPATIVAASCSTGMRTSLAGLVVAFVVSGCGPGSAMPPGVGGGAGGGAGTAGGSGGGTAVTGPTWAQNVAPLVSKNCAACHIEGGIAPFALTTYAQAKTMAPAMAADVEAKRMPPWMPGPNTPALLHARVLTDAEIAIFRAWADNGAPEGDTGHAATLPPPEVIPFGPADATFDIGADYTPDANLTDDYRCFLADPKVMTDRMALAFQVTPGNRKVVHHVIVSLYDGASKAALQALDDKWSGPGWQCFGGAATGSGAVQVGSLGAWVPGVSAVAYPTGTANTFPAGALAVIQVHYNLAGGHDPDRTQVAVQFAPAGQTAGLQAITGVPVLRHNLAIPPASTGHVEENTAAVSVWSSLSHFPADGDAWAIGVAGHMHLLGRRFEIIRTSGGVEKTLLDIPAWDFHWQGVYYFKEAIPLKKDDKLTVRCTFDNPGAQMVAWGEGTTDEMCLGQLQVVDSQPPAPQ